MTIEEIRKIDPWYNYRKDEFLPEIWQLMEQARIKRDKIFIPDYRIDKVLQMQNEDVDKCIAYIKYAFIGGASWLDVYGEKAEAKRKEKRKENQIKQIENKLDLILFMLQEQAGAVPEIRKPAETKTEKYLKKNQIKMIFPEYKKEA